MRSNSHCAVRFALASMALLAMEPLRAQGPEAGSEPSLKAEKLAGEGVWIDPRIEKQGARRFIAVVWFEEQLLGDGQAYLRRIADFDDVGRRELRQQAERSLKAIARKSHEEARLAVEALVADGRLADLQRHWIVNSFSGITTADGVEKIKQVAGVRKIFFAGLVSRAAAGGGKVAESSSLVRDVDPQPFDAERYSPPWYVEKLQVDRVWKELGVTGEGVLNVVNDGNFVLSANVLATLYRNEAEPLNGEDDDGNGLIDDRHGYDFRRNSASLTPLGQLLHGHQCAAIICGVGSGDANGSASNQLGLAPQSRWAGVIAGGRIEAAVEWAIEHGADTYSMSFSRPGLGEYRSHWRKMFEHGALCGVHFVSGAGNFAQKGSSSFAPVPVQMRTPEDIPQVVFAAAGVQRDLSRTSFSSQGPVEWRLEHYNDGTVDKPEVCAFNFRLPQLLPGGEIADGRASGNSFAGPMFCGTIALMLSANPDLKPWEVRQIIIDTARDVGADGFDHQTGHGLIDAFAAVERALKARAEQ